MNFLEFLRDRRLFSPDDPPAGDPPPANPTPPAAGDNPPDDPPAGDPPAGDPPPKTLIDGDNDDPPAFGLEEVTVDGLKETLSEHLEGVEIDDTQFGEFTSLINEATSREELASKLIQWDMARQQSAAEAADAAWLANIEAWQTEVKSSPEFGGEKLEQSLANAKQVSEQYGGAEFFEMLRVTGVGNHLQMVAFLNRVYKEMPKEGAPVTGTPGTPTDKPLADRLFGG